MYCVNSKYFTGLYRNKFSGYAEWREDGLDCGVYFNSANIGPYMSLDETCLSNGEVWTLLTNKDGHTLFFASLLHLLWLIRFPLPLSTYQSRISHP